jgi:large subunit GTPase 1
LNDFRWNFTTFIVTGIFQLHVADLKDGYDWARLNLQSVTEEDSFTAFLKTAELAGTEFVAEKMNIQFVNPKSTVGVLTEAERKNMEEKITENKELLKIPRRPKWDKDTTPDELHARENQAFLEWRRDLALLQEKDGMLMTPYERNIEFWRQLWRVIEKSDVVVQIVDARNPLLFRSEDLEKYVKEVDENKQNLLLLNKADFLTEAQRIAWAEYFDRENIRVAFFSAVEASAEGEEEEESDGESEEGQEESEESSEEDEGEQKELSLEEIKEKVQEIAGGLDQVEKALDGITEAPAAASVFPSKNDPKILTRLELIEFFKAVRRSHPSAAGKDSVIIGLMGYPNVGKSSTINALLQEKKVSVSATPGKTKHFQTLYLEKDLILCDCCGLVLPSFCVTKADMILNGILPIDQMRDYVPPVNTMCTMIPRHVLEEDYGILIAKPLEGEDPNRPPHAEELLLAYGYNRGFMTANGQPDQSRAARKILKDFVNGKLLFCCAPPTVKQTEFHTFPERSSEEIQLATLPPRQQRSMKIATGKTSGEIDAAFFNSGNSVAHVQGRNLGNYKQGAVMIGAAKNPEKPWKGQKREKREKLRRKYVHLDQH